MGWVVRLGTSIAAAAATAFVIAIVVAVADIWVTGHGYTSINVERISWRAAGVHLGFGDLIVLGASALAAVAGWYVGGSR